MTTYFTEQTNFFGKTNPEELLKQYGSPLYVYNESILRDRCHDMATLVSYPKFTSNYSIKANSNIEILKIAREEGLHADAMSPGEIHVLLAADYKPEELFYVGNNVSAEEFREVIAAGVMVSCDSLSQLELYGQVNPGGKVAIRFNPGVGAGHHAKVVTGGKNTKFGVNKDLVHEVKEVLKKYNLKLAGINQHVGSLFMEPTPYIEGVKSLLEIAEQFEDLEFVDMGGGFGIPYKKQEGQPRLELEKTGEKLTQIMNEWTEKYGKKITFKMEPGRYIVAESGVLLGRVYAKKQNSGKTFVGTDLGFNVLARPVMYDSYHEIEVFRDGKLVKGPEEEQVSVVGNICESGDIIAKERMLPQMSEGDIVAVMDAGAYGYSMSSNYNNRLRPAEVMICKDGSTRLIRRRDTYSDLMRNFNV